MYLSVLMFEISVKFTRETYGLCVVTYPEISTVYYTSATGQSLGRDPFSYNDQISFSHFVTSFCRCFQEHGHTFLKKSIYLYTYLCAISETYLLVVRFISKIMDIFIV